MIADITIEWTDAIWDPLAGCTRKSAACRHCYAEALTAASAQNNQWGHGFAEMGPAGPSWTGTIALREDRLALPLTWNTPRRVLVNSLSDLFHEAAPIETIDRVFAIMALAPHHTFQVLTKSPKIMQAYIADTTIPGRITRGMDEIAADAGAHVIAAWPMPNVWLGVTSENQKEAERRIPVLLQTPATVRWIAAEPLLEPIDLKLGSWLCDAPERKGASGAGPWLDWVVAGGEIGAEAQPCHPDWARLLRDQCAKGGTAFFWRQWGEYIPTVGVIAGAGPVAIPLTWEPAGARPSMRTLDGAFHDTFPEPLC
jgi:protein gp37